MFYVRRQLLTDDRKNIFPMEACSAVVQFKNSYPFWQHPFSRTNMEIGRPQMLFGIAVTLFARVANVQNVTEVAFTDFFRKKENFCCYYSFLRGANTSGTWCRTIPQNRKPLPLQCLPYLDKGINGKCA